MVVVLIPKIILLYEWSVLISPVEIVDKVYRFLSLYCILSHVQILDLLVTSVPTGKHWIHPFYLFISLNYKIYTSILLVHSLFLGVLPTSKWWPNGTREIALCHGKVCAVHGRVRIYAQSSCVKLTELLLFLIQQRKIVITWNKGPSEIAEQFLTVWNTNIKVLNALLNQVLKTWLKCLKG